MTAQFWRSLNSNSPVEKFQRFIPIDDDAELFESYDHLF